jgi:hypothetical protein
LEKFWNIAAAELSWISIIEVYEKYCTQDHFYYPNVNYDGFDFSPLIPTIITQKRAIRKFAIQEYAKQYVISKLDIETYQ